ncbi:amidoligase [Bacillus phage 035JT001]|nr:amidoligase [Bacillus phage 035JT001]
MKNQRILETEAQNAVTGREEKRIGIEIEFFGVDYGIVVNALRQAGLNIVWENYTHRTTNHWKLVYDASVTGQGTGAGRGLELVSPPLTIDEMDEQLETALRVLNEIGAKVDRTCGVHVHHEIDDLNLDQIKNIFALYKKHEEHIDEMMPPSRKNGRYCQVLTDRDISRVKDAVSIENIMGALGTRYKKINFMCYLKYGTIEFRQHSGSIDFTKLINWVRITQALVSAAKNRKRPVKELTEAQKKRATEAFTKDLKIEYTVQAIYSRDRKKELKLAAKKREMMRQASAC